MQNITKYKIVLKRGITIQIDEDEVEAVKRLISEGGLVQVRQGVFDSSSFEALIEDEERTQSCTIKRIDDSGKIYYESEKLEDLFEKNKTDDLQHTLAETTKSLETVRSSTDKATPEQIKEAVQLAREQREELKNCTLRE